MWISKTALHLLAMSASDRKAADQDAVNTNPTSTLAQRSLDNVTITTSATTAHATQQAGKLKAVSGTTDTLASPREKVISGIRSDLAVLFFSNDFGCLTDGLNTDGQPLKTGWRPSEKNATREMIFTEKRERIGRDVLKLLDEFEHDEYDCYAGTSWSADNIANTTTSPTLAPSAINTATPTISATTTTPRHHYARRWRCGNDNFYMSPREEPIQFSLVDVQYLFITNDFGCIKGSFSVYDHIQAGWKPARDNVTKAELFTDNRSRIGNEIVELLREFKNEEFDCYANSTPEEDRDGAKDWAHFLNVSGITNN